MLRNLAASWRVWIVLGAGAWLLLTGAVVYRAETGYRHALATFGVRPSEHEEDMAAVAGAVLARAPIGSPRVSVIALLDSLGFRQSTDPWDRQPAFHTATERGHYAIYAHLPFRESVFSLSRFFCDAPAISLTLHFDDEWRVTGAEATTARACV